MAQAVATAYTLIAVKPLSAVAALFSRATKAAKTAQPVPYWTDYLNDR